LLPAAAAQVADLLSERERSRGMAWLSSAASLGVITGPALSGLLSATDWHFRWQSGHFRFDGFSVPFFVAAGMALIAIVVVLIWVSESRPEGAPSAAKSQRLKLRDLSGQLRGLLLLTVAIQLALTVFESTLVLFSRGDLAFSIT
ncbi:MFS transporter, partial [Bradyrhizobium sp. NBAIM08]|uniref:MFS transporter n=1 Tax=Bradyrhizobium sp. NBAIM08 TaxID=2793815 RepID=UPI001CD7B930